jgi:hypothetical protein
MAETVNVTLSVPRKGRKVGDRLDVSPAEARRLVDGGIAKISTKPDARKAGVDPETAATAKS